MALQNQNLQQIVRKDGSNCFVEVLNSAFPIGRVLMKFINYDKNAAQGSKFVDMIEIYLTIPAFLRLCHDVNNGRIDAQLSKLKQDAINQGYKYAFPITLDMGGKSAKKLAAAGKSRPDNMSLSRQLKLTSGDKRPYLLMAESGPGEEDQKGLIVPRYKTPEHRVTIPLSYEDFVELLETTKFHLQAYLASDYVANPVEKRIPSFGQNGTTVNAERPYRQQPQVQNSNYNSQPRYENNSYNTNNQYIPPAPTPAPVVQTSSQAHPSNMAPPPQTPPTPTYQQPTTSNYAPPPPPAAPAPTYTPQNNMGQGTNTPFTEEDNDFFNSMASEDFF